MSELKEKSGRKTNSARGKSNCDDSRQDSDGNSDNSSVSYTHPPSLVTRLKQRKLERRKARQGTASSVSTGSTLNSDVGKSQREPILITIDSDCDEVSTVTSRRNRAARVHGELIRKFGKLSCANAEGSKHAVTTEYDSDDEKDTKKKRKKKKKSDMNKQITSRSNKQKLDGKKLGKTRVLRYTRNRSLKIRNLRIPFEHRQKKITRNKKTQLILPETSSCLHPVSLEKSPRMSSLTAGLGTCNDEKESVKRGRPKRKVSTSQIKSNINEKCETENFSRKKAIDNGDIEDDIRKILNASKPSPVSEDKSLKPSSDDKDVNSSQDSNCNLETTDGTKCSQNIVTDSTEINEDAGKISGKEDNEVAKRCNNNKNDERKCYIESDLEKIRFETPDTMIKAPVKNSSDKRRRTRNSGLSLNSNFIKRSSHKEKKVKTPIPGIVRKRGRPRLSESNQTAKSIKAPGIPFLQNSFCFDMVANKLPKCRECKLAQNRSSRKMYNSYCRFMEYRKLYYSKTGQLFSAGFSLPSDATEEHLNLWLPQPQNPPKDLDSETAKSLLEHTGDQFCDLIEQEKEALSLNVGDPDLTWKRIVQGVREMCDVCSTTIFNIHWVCPSCGFSVCIDCYKVRKLGIVDDTEIDEEQPKESGRDEFSWLLCVNRQPHDQQNLQITQIIPSDALWIMKDLMHQTREGLHIESYCKCNPPPISITFDNTSTAINKKLMSHLGSKSSLRYKNSPLNNDCDDCELSAPARRFLEGTRVHDNIYNLQSPDATFDSFEDYNLLSSNFLLDNEDNSFGSENYNATFSLEDIIASVTKACQNEDSEKNISNNFNKRYPQPKSGRDPLPCRIYTKMESDLAFPSVPHSWLCHGKLLFLEKPDHPDNLALFQEMWKRGQPVLVKNVQKNLDMTLWHPDGFCRDFGDVKNDLIDCKTGAILKSLPMRRFWEGFENFSKRLTDDNNEYMLLKLKDWPPGEDFSEKLPRRFEDLMKGLPLPEYTHRNGILNLAGRLPTFFSRPDLGPKMYNAYGSALYPTKGTTNLHLDVSDAVNVMVYVGIPLDGNSELHIQEALKAIDDGGCDSLMRARVRENDAKPGALWHIYNARDADKIRDLLTKVAKERGEKLEARNDPIHDQSWYLDTKLRERLYQEYGVEGYAIAQCLGDAVFIPAGAPHQVRNLHSCVKVAEDFVSSENIAHCFKLTQEFRSLSETHTNHEDKLQIKNIIYHVIRDAMSHLMKIPVTFVAKDHTLDCKQVK